MEIRSGSKRQLTTRIENWALKTPLRITGRSFSDLQFLVVTISDGEQVGQGEAAGVYYREETAPSIRSAVESIRDVIEAGADREALRAILPPGGARNAVDCALWELEARQRGRPVWKLAGVPAPKALVSTYTLGVEPPDELAASAAALREVLAIKLKLDGGDDDALRVRAVRKARPDVWLGVDANQGFTRASLMNLLPTLQECGVSLIEQPLPVGKEDDLEGLECPILLAADESVQGVGDVAGLQGRFDVVNIKLDKCGGLTEAFEMVAKANRLGLKTMVGNMMGTSRSLAPAFVLGQLCDFADLDGPFLLESDVVPGAEFRNGHVWCGEGVWGG